MKNPRPFIAVYLMASGRNGTLYTGVTSNLQQRVFQHKTGAFSGFSARYGCARLVWWEQHYDMPTAIAREKAIKGRGRTWKLRLIESANPEWRDLSDEWRGWEPLLGSDPGEPE